MAIDASSEKPRIGTSPGEVTPIGSNSAAIRRCEYCLLQHPLEQFRRRYRGEEARMWQCRQCHNLRERLRRVGHHRRVSRREIAKTMTHLKNCTAASRIPALCAEMVGHMGGAEGFLATWKDCINRDLERGGLPAFRHIAMLLKFMQYCEPQPIDYSTMSDEELIDRAIAAGLDV